MKNFRSQGMSLLELLVVLVIVSLVSTAMVQGLGFGLSLYQRVAGAEAERAKKLRTEEWFRLVNMSLVAQKEPGESLIGSKEGFSAYSMNPLISDDSIVRAVAWDINDGELRYREAGVDFLPIQTIGFDSEFSYLDEAGRWHSSWPLNSESFELPRAVRLTTGAGKITATVRMRRIPNLMLEESRRDRG